MAKHGHGGKHEEHEEHADESWLVPYADVLTLLLALFIVLFATAGSGEDESKMQSMMEAFYEAFTGEEYVDKVARGTEGFDNGEGEFDFSEIINVLYPSSSGNPSSNPSDGHNDGKGDAGKLVDFLNDYINGKGLSDKLKAVLEGEYALLTLRSDAWFDSGSAAVKPEMREIIDAVADLLNQTNDSDDPWEVVIAGHTDNVPQHSAQYPDNWALSLGRAYNFLVMLRNNHANVTFDPGRLSLRGYGEDNPIATNDTAEGRALNRRVEIQISHRKDKENSSAEETTTTTTEEE